ncbi:MAG: hypothetical protein JWN61_309, partial [Pseudonocardiales bacterium]|nr:hypothetical protein [Pseudonocardiales bacterium]
MFALSSDPRVLAVDAMGAALIGLDQVVDDVVRIDRIQALERLRGIVAAAQAVEAAAFADSQTAAQIAAGAPRDR